MKGFTLIELLVTVMIIGILASVALPQYTKAIEKARATEALVVTKALQDAIQRHMQEFPNDPVEKQGQIADVKLSGGTWVTMNGGTPEHKGDANCFLTRNFFYALHSTNNGSIFVARIDNPADCNDISDAKYVVSFPAVVEGTSRVDTSFCPGPGKDAYDYICSIFE